METITATVEYVGDLRTKGVHLKSGNTFTTDAPTDNQGKGEAFSPTDLVSAALSSCMMTIMGQVANREGVDMKGLKTEVVKIMTSNPRKIAEIKINFSHSNLKATDIQKQKLMNAARTCPVALSLSESLKQTISFNW
ncbi:MAG: OsmC family protein [Bacteroidetes bacterium]|nr:OsmC family protein [Bacteroidota bacterium]